MYIYIHINILIQKWTLTHNKLFFIEKMKILFKMCVKKYILSIKQIHSLMIGALSQTKYSALNYALCKALIFQKKFTDA